MNGAWRPVCRFDGLAEGRGRAEDVGDVRVAVFRWRGRAYALGETCPHRGGPIHAGEVGGDGVVACPWHGWRFGLASGRSPLNPASRVPTFPTRVENGVVEAWVGTDAPPSDGQPPAAARTSS